MRTAAMASAALRRVGVAPIVAGGGARLVPPAHVVGRWSGGGMAPRLTLAPTRIACDALHPRGSGVVSALLSMPHRCMSTEATGPEGGTAGGGAPATGQRPRARPRAMSAAEAAEAGVDVGGGEQAVEAAAAAAAEAERQAAAAQSTASTHAAGEATGGSGGAASGHGSGAAAARPSRWYNFVEGVKDVVAVTFGMERRRDLGREYDMGLREYPWIEYKDPVTDKLMYSNRESGIVTDQKPADFDARAKPTARVVVNEAAADLTVIKTDKTAWQRTLDSVTNAPLIASLLSVGQVVADSAVGKKASEIKTRIADKVEDAREVWETSQHPLIVNAAYAVDSLTSETEQGRALREIQLLDSGFDQYSFIQEMTDVVFPTVTQAFFRLDMPTLHKWCQDSALAQMRAVAAARERENVVMDGTVLAVKQVDVITARTIDMGPPVIVVSGQVQYIHCIRNSKGVIVEGSDSNLKAAAFVLAVTRHYNPDTTRMEWKVVEMHMQEMMLYL